MTTSSRRATSANATLMDASVNEMLASLDSRSEELHMKVDLFEDMKFVALVQIVARGTAARKVPKFEPKALMLPKL